MKNQWMLLTAVCMLFVGSALAQNDFTQKMTGNVPFDFVVNGTTFPKGEYIVSTASNGHRLLIQNKTDSQYSTFITNNNIVLGSDNIHDRSKMVFALTDGQHVLHQICIEGDNHTHDIIHKSDVVELVATR